MPAPALENMTLAQLGDELNRVVHESREIERSAEKEGRTRLTFNAAEQERIVALGDVIPRIKELQSKKQKFQDSMMNISEAERMLVSSGTSRTPSQQQQSAAGKLTDIVWQSSAAKHLPRQYQSHPVYGCDDYKRAFSKALRGDTQAISQVMAGSAGMSLSDEEKGGFFATSEAFATGVLKNVDDVTVMHSIANIIMMPPGAQSYGIRTRTAKASTFQWGNENTDMAGMQDTSLKYGKRTMLPHFFMGSVVVSKELIRNYPGAESMVMGEISLNASEVLEQSFLYADGNNKALGVMVNNLDGISSGRDLTSSAAADFNFDDIVSLKYNLKPRYRRTCQFMFHRQVLKKFQLLKDGEGRYLWEPSRQQGEPDLILGIPFIESEWMPSTFTTGLYYLILGDFQYYYILWDMAMQMHRLDEMRARTNEFEYLFRCKLDAQPVLEEAFTRGVLG